MKEYLQKLSLLLFVRLFLAYSLGMGIILSLRYGIESSIYVSLITAFLFASVISVWLTYSEFLLLKNLKRNKIETILERRQSQSVVVNDSFPVALQTAANFVNLFPGSTLSRIVIEKEQALIAINVPPTVHSPGERVLLSLTHLDAQTTKLFIFSKPKWSMTVLDGGKNVENIRLILERVTAKDSKSR